MRVLFVHPSFPGQYRHVARTLAADQGNRIVFATRQAEGSLPGVEKRLFAPHRGAASATHPYVRPFEDAVIAGQAAYRLCRRLRAEGFVPDLVCAHAGFGPGLFVKEAFPEAPLLAYFEWFYRSADSDADYLDGPLHPDDACRLRSLNAALLIELATCDWGLCPTRFQRAQFPTAFQDKLTLIHDGIDTDLFAPRAAEDTGPIGSFDIEAAGEVLTYATRGMEPYRGFPQFMRAAALLLDQRPRLHVCVAGADTVAYSARRADGLSYRSALLAELSGHDLSRLHFLGPLPGPAYRRLLRISTVHTYLTVPFVLSWSLLEAMASGCAIVASDTAPVREVIADGTEGLLADMRDPSGIAARIATLLDDPERRAALGQAARKRVLAEYRLAELLPRQLRLMRNLAASGAGSVRPAEPAPEKSAHFENIMQAHGR